MWRLWLCMATAMLVLAGAAGAHAQRLLSTAPQGDPLLDRAAELALAGRLDEAKAALGPAARLDAARAYAACVYEARGWQEQGQCRAPKGLDARLLLLDQLLNRPDVDAYPLAEVIFGLKAVPEPDHSAQWAAVTCRLFEEVRYGGICEQAREDLLPGRQRRKSDARPPDPTPRFQVSRISRWKRRGPSFDRDPFGGFEPLPGFRPVRMEQDGLRAAVISQSDHYDASYISPGGYWVHLSDDGGQTWRPPLYTGLVAYHPYVVVPNSRLPLFHGDALQIAAELHEIIPASTRPVYGLEGRREKDIALTIPIAELASDRDGDGMTDIAEEHFGLRPDVADDFDRPLGPAGSAPTCPLEAIATEKLRQEVMDAIFARDAARSARWSVPEREGREIPTLAAALSDSKPHPVVLLLGGLDNYACLSFGRPALVYEGFGRLWLDEQVPDAETLYVGRFVHNARGDRGYMVRSYPAGFERFRARRVDGKWELDVIGGQVS